MCLETEFTVFALGRCMLNVESDAKKLFTEIQELKLNEYKLVNISERFLNQIDDLREDYTKLFANVLELVKDKRDSLEHRETAKRIEAIFDECRKELWQRNCDKLVLDESEEDEFKDVPVFSGIYSKWAEFRRVFLSRVLSNLHLNKYKKMVIFTKKVDKTIRSALPSTESLGVQWQMLCNRYDTLAAKYHVGELFQIQGTQGKNLSHQVDSAFKQYQRHVEALNTLGFKCDPLSEMLIGRLIQWKIPNLIDVKFSQNRFTWSKVKSQLENIIHDLCYLCKGKHVLRQCNEFIKLSFEERIDEIQRLKVCIVCFSSDHRHIFCNSNRKCQKCRGRHNTMMHPEDNNANKLMVLKMLVA